MKYIIFCIISLFIVGCSTNQTNYLNFNKINSDFGAYQLNASSIQLTNDIALTAKHVSSIENGYKCSVSCDLVFFKNKSNHFDKNLKWRDPIFGEEIISVGNSLNNITIKRSGIVLDRAIKPSEDSKFLYYLNTARTESGMSGGPVYAVSDGAIVGMTIGIISKDFSGIKKNTSIFIPYHIIKNEYNKIFSSDF